MFDARPRKPRRAIRYGQSACQPSFGGSASGSRDPDYGSGVLRVLYASIADAAAVDRLQTVLAVPHWRGYGGRAAGADGHPGARDRDRIPCAHDAVLPGGERCRNRLLEIVCEPVSGQPCTWRCGTVTCHRALVALPGRRGSVTRRRTLTRSCAPGSESSRKRSAAGSMFAGRGSCPSR